MIRDAAAERAIRRAAQRLGDLVERYGHKTGRRLGIMVTDDGAYVIDERVDSGLLATMPTRTLVCSRSRGAGVEDGGIVVMDLPGGGCVWSAGELP